MSRKAILSLATATIIAAGLASTAADARGFGGGSGGGRVASARSLGGGNHLAGRGNVGRLATLNPGRGGRGGHPGHGGLHGHHHHRIFRNGIWIDVDGYADDYVDAPVVATPGPCTCLTKTYTKDGLVVFADVCTKEAASARVDGTATGAIEVPTDGKATPLSNAPVDNKATAQQPTSPNYAGRTYADFLGANSQAVSQAAQKN
ncbi:MAG: hypothetical protein ABSB37_05130 [Xanthobacteraceae bacterium]|jgi:hypothetical protein